jgi:predicted dehydrogenase
MRDWKIAIIKDKSKPMLGLHGLHTAFRGLPNVTVVALVDSNTDDLEKKMAQTQALRHYMTCREMLEHETPDIVVITSRHPGDHLGQIRMIAEKGCHIYCEKPLSAYLEEVDEIIQLAKKHGIKFGMAHPKRHDLGFRTMKRMIDAGEIGRPLSVVGRGKCDHRGGGEDLIVLGTHILDLQTYFLGAPESVMADIRTDGRPAELTDRVETVEPIGPVIGDDIFAAFQLKGGARGTFETRRGLYHPDQAVPHIGILVMGTEGSLSLRSDDRGSQDLLISRHCGYPENKPDFEAVPLHEDRVIPGAEPLDTSLCGHMDVPQAPSFLAANRFAVWDLMQAIEEDREPLATLEDARIALEMIYGIYAAHLSRSTVTLPLKNRAHPLAKSASSCASTDNAK